MLKRHIGLLVLVGFLATAGCNNADKVDANAELVAARADLAQFVTTLNQPPPAGTPTNPQAERAKLVISEFMTEADKAFAVGQAVLAATANNEDPGVAIREGGAAVAMALPLQYQPWVLLGTTLAGAIGTMLYRRSAASARAEIDQVREAARSIGRAIEKAKDDAGMVDFNDTTVKNNLRADMGAEATKLVDEGRGNAG